MKGSGCRTCPVRPCYRPYRGSSCCAIRASYGLDDPQTIGDQIRAIFATDEGIAKILLALDISLVEDGREFTHLYCDGKNNCITEDDGIICTAEMRTSCILRWLRQPAEQAPTATVAEYEKQHSGLIDEED